MEPIVHIWQSFCHLVQVRQSDFCSYHSNRSVGIFWLSWFICFYFAYALQILISYLMQIFLLVLEKYFDMKKNQCKEGLDIYKKFLTRMTRISEFLKVAEVNLNQSTLPFIWNSLWSAYFIIKQMLLPSCLFAILSRVILFISILVISSFGGCFEKPDCDVLIGLSFTWEECINVHFNNTCELSLKKIRALNKQRNFIVICFLWF